MKLAALFAPLLPEEARYDDRAHAVAIYAVGILEQLRRVLESFERRR